MLPTPRTDFWEEHESFTLKDVQVTIGNETSSKYINVLHCREIERECQESNEKLKIALEQWQLCLEQIAKITDK